MEVGMRNIKVYLFLLVALSFVVNGCRTNPTMAPTSTVESVPSTQTTILPTSTIAPIPILPTSTITSFPILPTPTNAPTPIGRTFVIVSAEDSGPGTLRQAILFANSGDTIEFDPSIFPPDQPKIINLKLRLEIFQEYLKIDATHAGVILDGSEFPDYMNSAFQIHSSNNTIRGFTLRNFPGGTIYISSGHNNLIVDNVIGGGDDGISLGGPETRNNVITGNYIGVLKDSLTTIPNKIGIAVGGGAHNNQIGPNNVIAFNNQFGILFPDSFSLGNTITQNSIHDNGLGGIYFGISFIEGNKNLSSPIITDFDLDADTLAGTTCAECTVEIFSDNNDQGAIYEGQTKADDNGVFTIDNITTFAGPWLTITATDANGNTSDFSLLSVGLKGLPIVQEGNDQPKTRMVITPFEDLADNRIGHLNPVGPDGDGSCLPVERNYRMNEHLYWGTKWQFLGLDMGEWEEKEAWGDGWYSRSEMTEYQDCTISLLVENSITLVARLNYWDEELHAERKPDYGNEQEVQLFLDHTRFLVSHYKGLIQYYGILNEPNYYVEVEDYINLIRKVIPVIREEDPEAKIVVGEIPELDKLISRDYLFEILQSDIMPDVDAIAIHPMYGTSPQFEDTREYYYSYPSLLQEIKDTATANGFRGEYMATEMTWGTPNLPTPQPWLYPYKIAAKYYTRGIVTTLGMNVIAGFTGIVSGPEKVVSNPFIVQGIRNLSDVMAGATAIDLPIEILSESTNIKSYSFSLPNDEMMIALWSDGAAVEDDPGVTSSLIIPGYTGFTASGIDVLFNFEQELISSNENGDMVIPDFVIKDYPIFIRLSK
jgi:hypothetical protein